MPARLLRSLNTSPQLASLSESTTHNAQHFPVPFFAHAHRQQHALADHLTAAPHLLVARRSSGRETHLLNRPRAPLLDFAIELLRECPYLAFADLNPHSTSVMSRTLRADTPSTFLCVADTARTARSGPPHRDPWGTIIPARPRVFSVSLACTRSGSPVAPAGSRPPPESSSSRLPSTCCTRAENVPAVG